MDSEHHETSNNSTTAGSDVNYNTDIESKSRSLSVPKNGYIYYNLSSLGL